MESLGLKDKSVGSTENPLELANLLLGKAQNLIKTLPAPGEMKIFLGFRDPNDPTTWEQGSSQVGELDLVDKSARSMNELRATARLARRTRALVLEQVERIKDIKRKIEQSRKVEPGQNAHVSITSYSPP